MKRGTAKSTQGQRLQQMHLTETHLLSVYAFIILCYVKTITAISFTNALSPLVRHKNSCDFVCYNPHLIVKHVSQNLCFVVLNGFDSTAS